VPPACREQREEIFAQLAQASLRAMGMTSPSVSARLFVAMTSEAALIEMEAGRRVKSARDAIHALAKAREA
jgi:hypothetical protein